MENANAYITIMLQDNEQLKNYLAGYLNNRLAIQTLHPALKTETQEMYDKRLEKEITEQERQTMINTISLFRGYATRLNTSINSLARRTDLDKQVLNQITDDYKEIKTHAAPEYDICERFVQNINNLLEENIDLTQIVNAKQNAMDLATQTKAPSL